MKQMSLTPKPMVTDFTLHDAMGNTMFDKDWLQWLEEHNGEGFGPTISYSWRAGNKLISAEANTKTETRWVLPDGSGFICIQSEWKLDNCLLLDAYGNERIRLVVPWQLTKSPSPESAKPPTSFARVCAPYVSPIDGSQGVFGVQAWVEHAGQYYFELDYRSGQFLWGKEIKG